MKKDRFNLHRESFSDKICILLVYKNLLTQSTHNN